MPDSCTVCGETENLHEHHRDGDRSNNADENLIMLCASHHRQVHGNGLNFLKDELVQELQTELPDTESVDVRCKDCEYEWAYSGLLDVATCPSCLSQTPV